MMNPTALRLRNVWPVESLACQLCGFRRVFTAMGGMASVVEGATDGGAWAVAHLISPKELRNLESREPPSRQVVATINTVTPSEWNGRRIRVAVSIEPIGSYREGLPTERHAPSPSPLALARPAPSDVRSRCSAQRPARMYGTPSAPRRLRLPTAGTGA